MASPELAPLIQAGGEVDDRVVAAIENACEPLHDAGVDTVILGCTHYPLVRPRSSARWAAASRWSPPARRSPRRSRAPARARARANDEDRRGNYRFMCSGDPEEFRRLGTRFLQLPLGEVATWTCPAARGAAA